MNEIGRGHERVSTPSRGNFGKVTKVVKVREVTRTAKMEKANGAIWRESLVAVIRRT